MKTAGRPFGVLVVVAFGALAVFAAISVVFTLRSDTRGAAARPPSATEIRLSLPIYYQDGALCPSTSEVCITPESVAAGVAFYPFDTHSAFRSQGCRVKWTRLSGILDPATGSRVAWGFRSGCSGATFDASGRWLFGPAPRDLDTFPLTQQGNVLAIDTATLMCHLIVPGDTGSKVGNPP